MCCSDACKETKRVGQTKYLFGNLSVVAVIRCEPCMCFYGGNLYVQASSTQCFISKQRLSIFLCSGSRAEHIHRRDIVDAAIKPLKEGGAGEEGSFRLDMQ